MAWAYFAMDGSHSDAGVGHASEVEFRPYAERWQSGRMYLTRNQAMSQGIRGFESHPLRQPPSRSAASGEFSYFGHIPGHYFKKIVNQA